MVSRRSRRKTEVKEVRCCARLRMTKEGSLLTQRAQRFHDGRVENLQQIKPLPLSHYCQDGHGVDDQVSDVGLAMKNVNHGGDCDSGEEQTSSGY
jgi:hypothetical protein